MRFDLQKMDGSARLGRIETEHGLIETPVFMPVGTRAAVKTLTSRHLEELEAKIILGNTYHLMLRPGVEVMEKAGGLHAFMNWDRPILTDSGGFQVFSLSDLNEVTDNGVTFRSHIDGARFYMGPKESMEIQKILGSDIVMAFDQCIQYPAAREEAERALQRTTDWGRACRDYPLRPHQNLFGIVQGGVYPDLRERSAKELTSLEFDGYAIGGLSVGEPAEIMNDMIEATEPHLPKERPRYLMGVGTPRNIVDAVKRGVDMFDCVMPTRNARNGTAFTWQGKINIKAGRYADDFNALDPDLDCYTSQFSKAYIRHLLNVDEITGLTLVTIQNIAFYLDMMKKLREAIQEGTFEQFYQKICALYPV